LVRLDKLIEAAEGEGRLALLIEGLAHQALAYQKLKEATNAMSVLARALRWAEPEGYVRLFADLGFSMAQLLQEAHIRGVSAGYVEKLLEAFGTSSGLVSTTGLIVLPEPLTPREQEILKFVAAGLKRQPEPESWICSTSIYSPLFPRASQIYPL
jgi:LuxR family transcriptional regulator, maltose regulon positive regulatory protein